MADQTEQSPSTAEQFAAFFRAALPDRVTLADLEPEADDTNTESEAQQ